MRLAVALGVSFALAGAPGTLAAQDAPAAAAAQDAPQATQAPAGDATSRIVTLPDGTTAVVQQIPAKGSPSSLSETPPPFPPDANPGAPYVIRTDHWSDTDEKEFSAFVTELGESGCNTVDKCLHDPRNPYRGTDPPGTVFESDCADLPYYLRFYYAWKRGLPFSFAAEVAPRGHTRDMRYTAA
ncbi:MAG TPA: hypothetical protein VMU01_02580, partial [Rhizomicrobium sp.]|nr:hypothetical protein [Rhizomicrobium sp.]